MEGFLYDGSKELSYELSKKEKIFTMKEYAGLDNNGQDMDISDPWGYNMNTYRMCAAEISLCVDKIIEKLTINNKIIKNE